MFTSCGVSFNIYKLSILSTMKSTEDKIVRLSAYFKAIIY